MTALPDLTACFVIAVAMTTAIPQRQAANLGIVPTATTSSYRGGRSSWGRRALRTLVAATGTHQRSLMLEALALSPLTLSSLVQQLLAERDQRAQLCPQVFFRHLCR